MAGDVTRPECMGCGAAAVGEVTTPCCEACIPRVQGVLSALRPDELPASGKKLSALRRGALRRTRDLARMASEVAVALANTGLTDEAAAKTMERMNQAWAQANGHDTAPAVALGEIILIIMSAAHTLSGTTVLSDAAKNALAAINQFWPEYGVRMNLKQLEGVIADWANPRRNAGKWKATAALLLDAGVRRSNPKNAAETVRAEFNRYEKGDAGQAVRTQLLAMQKNRRA